MSEIHLRVRWSVLLLLRLFLVAWRQWVPAFVVGLAGTLVFALLRLDPLPAVVVAFATGCLSSVVCANPESPGLEALGVMFGGAGFVSGVAASALGFGAPIEYWGGGWFPWAFVAFGVGWLLVAARRSLRAWRQLREQDMTPIQRRIVGMFPWLRGR